jgi:hypothetical protein
VPLFSLQIGYIMIRFMLVFWFIMYCLRRGVEPWNFFQLNAAYFNEEKGIFSKLEIDQYVPGRWRLLECYMDNDDTIPLQFPVFIKPEWGQNSHGIIRADSLDQYLKFVARHKESCVKYISQESAAGQKEFEVFYVRQTSGAANKTFFSITEVSNSRDEAHPINGIYNRHTNYHDCDKDFSAEDIETVWGYLRPIGCFRLARVGIKTDSKADLLAGNFSIFEINLFLPMPLFLLDQTIGISEKYTFIRDAMKILAAAVEDIPRDQKRKSIFFNMLKAHYRVKRCKLSKNSFISG